MSKILRKATLASAVAGALVFALPAFAVTVDNAATPGTNTAYNDNVANVAVADDTTVVTLPDLFVNVSNSDGVVGLNTNITVTLTVGNSAKIAAAGTASSGTAASGWTASALTSGTNGVVVSLTGGSTAFVAGNLIKLSGLQIENVPGLATPGNTISGAVTIKSGTSGTVLGTATFTAATSVDALKLSVGNRFAGDGVAIDVGTTTTNPVSSSVFTSDVTKIGTAQVLNYDAGLLTIGASTANNASGGVFGWTGGAGNDTVALTVTGLDLTPYTTANGGSVYLAANCGAAGTALNVAADGSKATLAAADYATVTGQQLCFSVAGGTGAPALKAGDIHVKVDATYKTAGTSTSDSVDGKSLGFNGPSFTLYNVNPASNSNQVSILRLQNTGNTDGVVTVTGVRDDGTAGGTAKVTLTHGQAVTVSTTDLENGNAAKGITGGLGAGSGKWTLTVTGDFSGLEVTNMTRSQANGIISNLGTPISGDH